MIHIPSLTGLSHALISDYPDSIPMGWLSKLAKLSPLAKNFADRLDRQPIKMKGPFRDQIQVNKTEETLSLARDEISELTGLLHSSLV